MSGFSVNVRSNADSVVMDMLSAATEMPQATVRALNKTLDQATVQLARQVRDVGYGLKVSDIKKALRKVRASTGNMRATIKASGKPLPLINYSARQTSKGVSVNVLNGRKVIASAFIATMPSGHRGVFVREPTAIHKKVGSGSKASWHALPIRELYGPSVPDAVGNEKVKQALQQLITDRFPSILQHEQQWLSRQVRKP
jgi:Prophage minor tail protein Z (GPZ)